MMHVHREYRGGSAVPCGDSNDARGEGGIS